MPHQQTPIESWEIDRRPIVVKDTSEGPVAFYKSTGGGTPGRVVEGEWVPFGGIVFSPGLGPWFVKIPASHPQAESTKILTPGSEFSQIASDLASMGLSPQTIDSTYEGVAEVNQKLEERGALKKDWAAARSPGLEEFFITDELIEQLDFLRGPLPHIEEGS